MFRIIVPVTKSHQIDDNTLEIEGIASDPSIDVENERMSEEAIKKMAESVNKGEIPIKIEHEHKLYSEV
jgi:hypothetical protein